MSLSNITVVLNGHTYNDASFLNDGHATAFLQALSDMLVEIDSIENFSTSASASATTATSSATSAATYLRTATSTSSLVIGTGSKTLTLAAPRQLAVGDFITVAYTTDPTKFMWGQVTNYDSNTLIVSFTSIVIGGSGTFAVWTVGVSGSRGIQGAGVPAIGGGEANKVLTVNGAGTQYINTEVNELIDWESIALINSAY